MRIGYAKLGRSIKLDPATYGPQGDPEAPNLLRRLALRNPEHTFVLVGKNDRYMGEMPPNVENPWVDLPGGQPYNNVDPGKTPPEGKRFIPYRNDNGGGFYVNDDALARDAYVTDIVAQLDGMVIHLGQHGTSHIEIPHSKYTWAEARADGTKLTTPQLWSRNYGEYLVRGMNAMGDRTDGHAPVSWICVDPRNYHKARDYKWPTGLNYIISQHQYSREQRHERFEDRRLPSQLGFDCSTARDGELWVARHNYYHAGAELMILDDDWATWGSAEFEDRLPAGIATTSFALNMPDAERRSWLVKNWLLDIYPDAEYFGKWDKKSLLDVEVPPQENTVEEFPSLLNRWRVSLALPALGSDWCAAKPYQLFAARCVAFTVGRSDKQGWILPSRHQTPEATQIADGLWSVRQDWTENDIYLARWLRVNTKEEFQNRAKIAAEDKDTWTWLVNAQRDLLQRRWTEARLESTIEIMMGLRQP